MVLKDRVIVVTGGARGMGREYVRGFLSEGCRVVALDGSWEETADFQKELEAYQHVLTLTADIANEADVDAAYRATLDRFGTVDVLINNAAMRQRDLFPPSGRTTVLNTKSSDWERMFAVNLFGTLKVIRHFIQPMVEQRRGSVVNISSRGSYVDLRPQSMEQPYMASKAALNNLTFYLAAEVQESNIAVNTVFPGHTRTTGYEEQNAARRAMGMRSGPEPVTADSVVPLVKFLAQQDANSGVTGKALDAMEWNEEHGLGDHARWASPEPSP